MIIFLAAQLMQPEMLPVAMEPAIFRYGDCIFPALNKLVINKGKKATAKHIEQAIASCAEVRATAVVDADAVLARDAAFADQKYRKTYIENRFEGLDAMARDAALGRGDPDNWNL